MIIQGLILTDKGPVDIKELKPGDKVLNQLHRAFAVKEIQNKSVSVAYTFGKNPKLIVSKGAILKTVYGNKKVAEAEKTSFYMAQPNMRMVKDKAEKTVGKYITYEIKAEGCDSIFAENYCFKLEDNDA